MISITNVSPEDYPMLGVNDYEIKINSKLICNFKHKRKPDGLAQCLRDAADAVDANNSRKIENILKLVRGGNL